MHGTTEALGFRKNSSRTPVRSRIKNQEDGGQTAEAPIALRFLSPPFLSFLSSFWGKGLNADTKEDRGCSTWVGGAIKMVACLP